MRPNVPRSRKKNGRTQCTSLSRTTSTTILALEKLRRRKNALERQMKQMKPHKEEYKETIFHGRTCFKNNGIYYEGQSNALQMKSQGRSITITALYIIIISNRGCLIEDKDRLPWQWQQRWRRRGTRGRVQNLHKSNKDELGSVHRDVLFLIHQS